MDILSAKRNPAGAIFHTEQGSAYLSPKFREKIRSLGMKQSCSARGVCWDNASMESANGIIKSVTVSAQTKTNLSHKRLQ